MEESAVAQGMKGSASHGPFSRKKARRDPLKRRLAQRNDLPPLRRIQN
jgi:hypothetical protein